MKKVDEYLKAASNHQIKHAKVVIKEEKLEAPCKPEPADKIESEQKQNVQDQPSLYSSTDDCEGSSNKTISCKRLKVEVEKLNDHNAYNGSEDGSGSEIKLEDIKEKVETTKMSSANDSSSGDKRCDECLQFLDDPDLKIYSGDAPDAVEEMVMLTDKRLSIYTDSESDAALDPFVEKPNHKVTAFSVYDKCNHLCPFDSGLIERNVELWFSGVVKPIYSEDADEKDGVVSKHLGPINEWWIAGYDGGEEALIGFSTEYADYILMEPNAQYRPYMQSAVEKIHMSKFVIEFVSQQPDATFDDLLEHIQSTTPPKGLPPFTQDALITHAQFIIDQISSYDSAADEDEPLLLTTRCIRYLIRLAGTTLSKRAVVKRRQDEKFRKPKKIVDSKATTTMLVQDIIGNFFPQMTDVRKANVVGKKKRCGVCASCKQPNCGKCEACKSLQKLGGKGNSKLVCAARVCLNVAVQEAEEDEGDEEEDCEDEMDKRAKGRQPATPTKRHRPKARKSIVVWVGKPEFSKGKVDYFRSVHVDNEILSCGDHVLVEPQSQTSPILVAKVAYLFEDEHGDKMFHAHWFMRGSETVLGETSDRNEVFIVDDCDDVPLGAVISKCEVFQKAPPPNWFSLGGIDDSKLEVERFEKDKGFFYQKWYDPATARFEDPPEIPEELHKMEEYAFCEACYRTDVKEKSEVPCLGKELTPMSGKEASYGSVKWRGTEYQLDDCVFIDPDAITFLESSRAFVKKLTTKNIDEEIYPEYYRKSDVGRGIVIDSPDPFRIGRILSIRAPSNAFKPPAEKVLLRIEVFYRPENTHLGQTALENSDINLLYWTNVEAKVRLSDCAGKCSVVCCNSDDACLKDFSIIGTCIFYFNESYNSSAKSFGSVPESIKSIFSSKLKEVSKSPSSVKKLRGMDVFAGCGGLSNGFHQAGVVETLWAIEQEEPAAEAFKKNNPKCTVYREDCNKLLKLVMEGSTKDGSGQMLPQKGEVDIILGGPPCQGFSGMNRFNYRQYSLFKNSLIASYLSYCDYYRPKFFILENVRNFVAFKKGLVLKLTLRCLTRMGYQCTFGVLQAGNYGVPQTRRRAIIIAAAPGEKLPFYPEPFTVFTSRGCQLSVVVDDKKYVSNIKWTYSAPYRRVTVLDGMSDLPPVKNGANNDVLSYAMPPKNSFQKMVRNNNKKDVLRDHVCKEMSALVEARFKYVPHSPGSDWRDLPNIIIRLNDGEYTKKLKYTHNDLKNGKSSSGALRGVCACAEGKSCDPMDRQFNTLIPWCLPHTGNRHNNWAGLYGRLSWDGFFLTTVTNPEPMGKQGCVVHPEQDRVVSVRECARSQGFSDSYIFYGSILDRHKQIGNAVPPPLAAAIALEVRKCIEDNNDC